MKRFTIIATLLLSLTLALSAQEAQTKNTLKLAAGQKGSAAKISDMAWLAGTWRGTGLGGESEEIWSEAQGGVMMGVYRMLMDKKPAFYEFMTLAEAENTLIIRLKHFHANLVGWEEKDKTVDFPFIKKEGSRYYFEGMTFDVNGKDEITIYVAISGRDGKVTEAVFKHKRIR